MHLYIHTYNTIVKVTIMFLIKAAFAWKHSECQHTAGMCLQLWKAAQLVDPLLYISCIGDGWRWKPGQSPSTSNLRWGLVLFCSSVSLCPVFCNGPWVLGRVCDEAAPLVAEHVTDLVPAARPVVRIRVSCHPPHRKKLSRGLGAAPRSGSS